MQLAEDELLFPLEPVKFMLDRDQELKLGGSRPSGCWSACS